MWSYANLESKQSEFLVPAEYLFIQTFWQTMNREWKGIDKLHLDKYYMVRSSHLFHSDTVTSAYVQKEHSVSSQVPEVWLTPVILTAWKAEIKRIPV
jgi:hypothetical protein